MTMCEICFFLLRITISPRGQAHFGKKPSHAGDDGRDDIQRAFSTTRSREPAKSSPRSLSLSAPETEPRFSPSLPCSTSPLPLSPLQYPPTAQSKPVQIPAPAASHNAHRHAQPALPPAPLPPAPLPHPRRHLHLLPLPGPGRCGASQGGGHGADGHGGGERLQRRGHERDAAAAGPLPALRALHLLRRAQGRLRPRPVLLRHQLQHPQPPLRVLLIHAKVLRLPRMQPLSPCFGALLLLQSCFARVMAGGSRKRIYDSLPDPGA